MVRASRWAVIVRIADIVMIACSACGDNTAVPDARPDGALPDLAIVPGLMNNSIVVANRAFGPSDCEVVERCAIVGTRRLLQFATATENRGPAELDLGVVPPDGEDGGIFVWSPCHRHHHIAGYAEYELVGATGVVATGRKQGFCLEDDTQIVLGAGSHGFNCHHQGISVGWADLYGNSLPCQWIDITDIAPGSYTLRVTIDPSGVLPDADHVNNVWSADVTF
jgi:hypothetical protein